MAPIKICAPVLNHVGRGEGDGRMELGRVDLPVLSHLGRGEDDERIEFKHLGLSFHQHFPMLFAFLFLLGLQSLPALSPAG